MSPSAGGGRSAPPSAPPSGGPPASKGGHPGGRFSGLVGEGDNRSLAALVRDFGGLSWSKAKELIRKGRVRVDGRALFEPGARPAAGARIEVDPHARPRRVPALEPERIVHIDHDCVVVNKPAGLVTVERSEREPDCLRLRVEEALPVRRGRSSSENRLYVVQRLDVETSGLIVFARTRQAKKALEKQLRARSIERSYLALAGGRVRGGTHDTYLIPNRGDGRRGSWRGQGRHPQNAKRAVTHVRLERWLGTASLVRCELDSGRQHQIRIHLAESGHPLLGDPRYGGEPGPQRVMLHAEKLGFHHPQSGRRMRFQIDPPEDFAALLAKLGHVAPEKD